MVWLVEGTPVLSEDEFYRNGRVHIPEYRVSYDSARKRPWMCECPHNTYRKVTCKHIVKCYPELKRHQELISWWHVQIGRVELPLQPEDRLEYLTGRPSP
jgi:hypothetical protein